MESFKDSIYSFFNENVFTRDAKSTIGQYGNDVVDLINKFIRIIIAFMIVYLIIVKLPDHGDKDHTMYFNLLLLISIFLILIYIQKNWRGYYLNDFLASGEYDQRCARDQDNPPDRIRGKPCPTTLEENGSLLVDTMTTGLIKELDPTINWHNYLYLIGLGLLLRQLEYKSYYALLIFIPFDSIKGIIYYILYASKYSPINFLFGKTGNVLNPYIYDGENKISESEESSDERELKNFNERFYVMYIVLILLIFFTIIIRLTSDTIINCKNFVGPIPINALQGCIGYRFYMVLNVLLFIGFSTDFMDSLEKISLETDSLTCPWKIDETGRQLPLNQQVYTSRQGECVKPKDVKTGTPQDCSVEQEILECTPSVPSHLPNCFIERTIYNDYRYTLKDVSKFNNENDDDEDHRIIIKENPDGGFMIDSDNNEIEINNPGCRTSIRNWLASQTDINKFERLPQSNIDKLNKIPEQSKNLLSGLYDNVSETGTNVLSKIGDTTAGGLDFVSENLGSLASSISSNNNNPNNSYNPNNNSNNPNNSNNSNNPNNNP